MELSILWIINTWWPAYQKGLHYKITDAHTSRAKITEIENVSCILTSWIFVDNYECFRSLKTMNIHGFSWTFIVVDDTSFSAKINSPFELT